MNATLGGCLGSGRGGGALCRSSRREMSSATDEPTTAARSLLAGACERRKMAARQMASADLESTPDCWPAPPTWASSAAKMRA
eukprot:7358491-Prymnesium_polylepis.1